MAENQTGLANILGGFAAFRDGVTALPPGVHEAEHAITQQTVSVSALHINGDLPGVPVVDTFWVDIRQIELAPAEDRLLSRYTPAEDKEFKRYYEALDKLGDKIPALTVLPANRDIVIDGQARHMYLVYDEPVIFYALHKLGRVRVLIRIVDAPANGEHGAVGPLLMESLAHSGLLHRPPSQLEVCDAVNVLHTKYNYTYAEIAVMEASIREERDPPSEQYVQAQIAVARLPETAKLLYHKGTIKWSHVRSIAWKFGGDDHLCTQLAVLMSQQGNNMSVVDLDALMQRIKDKHCKLETNADDVVEIVPLNQPLRLVPDNKSKKKAPAPPSYPATAAQPRAIRKAASQFGVEIAAGKTPDRPVVTLESFDRLSEWIGNLTAPPEVDEVEAKLFGFHAALHQAEEEAGLLNQKGVIGPTVDSSREAQG
jgi:hypothetical protein